MPESFIFDCCLLYPWLFVHTSVSASIFAATSSIFLYNYVHEEAALEVAWKFGCFYTELLNSDERFVLNWLDLLFLEVGILTHVLFRLHIGRYGLVIGGVDVVVNVPLLIGLAGILGVEPPLVVDDELVAKSTTIY